MPVQTMVGRIIEEQGRRQPWVAEQAGISRVWLNRLIHGHSTLTPRVADRLGRVLGVSPAVLLADQPRRNGHDPEAPA